jgi:hypothetical protein
MTEELQLTNKKVGFNRSTEKAVAHPARTPQQLVEGEKEEWVINGKWEGQVSHVTRTVDVVQRACST